jgi:hypothetical protein
MVTATRTSQPTTAHTRLRALHLPSEAARFR